MEMVMDGLLDNTAIDSLVEAMATTETTETTNKRNPLAKFNALSPADQTKVEEIVASVEDAIGGDSPDLELLLGILEKLNALKKTAREVAAKKAKEEKTDKANAEKAKGEALKTHLKVGDKIDYVAKTAKLTFIGVTIVKLTEKRVRVEVDGNTKVIDSNGNEKLLSSVADYKIGMKSIQFQHILKVNNREVEEILK